MNSIRGRKKCINNELYNNYINKFIISYILILIIGIYVATIVIAQSTISTIESINEELTIENYTFKEEIEILIDEQNKLKEELDEKDILIEEFEDKLEVKQKNQLLTINYNPHEKTGYNIDQLNQMLTGTGLATNGEAFYNMEQTYNVNSLFAIAVACHESANGFKKANSNNYFGFKGNNGWMSFVSTYDCIQYFGKLISNNYDNYLTIESIQNKYCPNSSTWSNYVRAHMKQKHNKLIN